ncbi:MAG: flippase-like domain-containing protein [Anaerolineales bacterium]|nr:flippase-like domain-containing protein [Anaerolineales bacterium]
MRWKRAAKILLVGAVLFFLGLNIYRGWRDASRFQWDIRPWPLIVSFTLALAFWLVTGLAWNLLVRYLAGSLTLRKGMKVYFLSNLGWYVPGKVWYAVGRAYLGQREGGSVEVISTSVLMEMVLSLTSSALMATLALPLLSPLLGTKSLYLGIAVLIFGLAALHPAPMKILLTLLERLLPGPTGTELCRSKREIHPPLRYSVMIGFLVGYLVIWSVVGSAFFVLLNAIHPLPLTWLPTVASIYAISWMAGFLAPFAPSGLGVREGAMILLLGQYLPVPAVTAAAILFRLWLILAELLWAAVATRW